MPLKISGIFYLDIPKGFKVDDIQVFGSNGKQLPLVYENGSLNLSDAPKGVYFMHLRSQKNLIINKLITY